MHEQRLRLKNLAHNAVNVESVMPSSMHVNMTAFTLRNIGNLVNNKGGGFNFNRGGGFVNRGGRGKGREFGKRIYC